MAKRKKHIIIGNNTFTIDNIHLSESKSFTSNYKYSFSFKREEMASKEERLLKNIETLIDKIK